MNSQPLSTTPPARTVADHEQERVAFHIALNQRQHRTARRIVLLLAFLAVFYAPVLIAAGVAASGPWVYAPATFVFSSMAYAWWNFSQDRKSAVEQWRLIDDGWNRLRANQNAQ